MRFMKQEGIPFFVWYIQFAGQVFDTLFGLG
jgi:hypothetical protein